MSLEPSNIALSAQGKTGISTFKNRVLRNFRTKRETERIGGP
jgi:hypothetical protein